MSSLAPTLQAFFTDRLIRERQASGHTIAAYRDTLRLLLAFAGQQAGRTPSDLRIADLDAPLVSAFLDHLETVRGNSVRTRNARLAAVHSLFRYAALRHPEDAAVIQRVLSVPPKRFDRTIVTYLSEKEADALLAAPDQSTRTGRRDHAMLATAIQTGLRASELVSLQVNDVHLGTGAHVSCMGKGRKQRITPLTNSSIPSAVKRISRYSRRRSSVDSRPTPRSRFSIVGVLSSAARMPFPVATSARAVSAIDAISIVHRPLYSHASGRSTSGALAIETVPPTQHRIA